MASSLGDLANVFKAFIGANFLSIPFAVRSFGLVSSCVFMLLIGGATRLGVDVLIQAKRSLSQCVNSSSYGFVAGELLGLWALRAVECCLLLTQYGFCIGYIIFLSKTLGEMVSSISELQSICIVTLLQLGMALIRKVKWLSPFSAVANVALFSGFVMCLLFELLRIHRDGTGNGVTLMEWSGFPLFFGMTTSAYEGIGCILTVENGMKKENRGRFMMYLDISLALLTAILVCFGVTSYLCFGQSLHDIIVEDIASDSWVAIPLKTCLLVGISFTYPLQMLPVFRIVERILLTLPAVDKSSPKINTNHTQPMIEAGGLRSEEDVPLPHHRRIRRKLRLSRNKHFLISSLLRLLIVISTAVFAWLLPSFHSIVSLVGSFGSAFLAFILPPWLFLAAMKRNDKLPSLAFRLLLYLLVVFGIAGGVVGTFYSFKEVFSL